MKRLLSVAICAAALLAFATGTAGARVTRADALATRSYLKARFVEVRARAGAYRQATKTVELLAAKVQAECRGALATGPHSPPAAEHEILAEVFGVVLGTPLRAQHGAAVSFARSVRRLHWSSRQLTRLVHSEAQRRVSESAIAPPDLCADLKAWAASGYTATSAATKSYVRRLNAVGAGSVHTGIPAAPQRTIKRLLARLENRADRTIARRTSALEAQQQTLTLKSFPEAASRVSLALHATS